MFTGKLMDLIKEKSHIFCAPAFVYQWKRENQENVDIHTYSHLMSFIELDEKQMKKYVWKLFENI